jgi:DNA-binding transcriptional MerR regulator
MKISELARRSGVSIPSIKFYLRERLLPAGQRSGANQAAYTEEHIRRLALIRALRDVGGLSIGAVQQVIEAIDESKTPTLKLISMALDALSRRPVAIAGTAKERAAAAHEIDGFLKTQGWGSRRDALAREELIDALIAIRCLLFPEMPVAAFTPHARAAADIARLEITSAAGGLRAEASRALETAVVGTVLWERVFSALRRVAHEHLTHELLRRQRPAAAPANPSPRRRAPR